MHISTARKILNSGKPVNLSVWKKDGTIMNLKDAVSLRFDFHNGTRNLKLVGGRGIRKIRDCCIFLLNDEEVRL